MSYTSFPKNFTAPHSISGIPKSAPILVAFSGGADSSALLYLMAEYGRIHGATVYAAHVNHMIRGEEADRDEAHCARTAEKLGIKLFIKRADVPSLAKERGESVETCARNVRYEFFDSLMEEYKIPLLATAHNANDNLETMIFNMIRGSGLSGMCGIPQTRSCRGGRIIRPILGMSREEILDVCEKLGIAYVTDSTNTDTDYTRNKIRSLVIPTLTEINSAAVDNAARLSRSLRSDLACLEGMTDMFLENIEEDMSVNTRMLTDSPLAIANRAVMAVYKEMCEGASLENVHLEAIMGLCRANVPHSTLHLPHKIEARIENGRLYMEKRSDSITYSDSFEAKLVEGENFISEINAKIIIGNSQSNINVYKNSILLYFASDKIIGSLTARERLAGDKIRIHGVNKSVKKLMCDKKIPLDVRKRLPVICDSEGIVAVPSVGICDRLWTKDKQNSVKLILQLL